VTDLVDFQHEVHGYVFGIVSPLGGIRVESWSGLGRPDQVLGDFNAPDADGTWFGQDWLGPRTFSWTCNLTGSSEEAVMALHDALADAWTFADRDDPSAVATYRFKIPGRETMVAYGRPRRFTSVLDQLASKLIGVTMDFYCGDPRLYSDDEITASLSLGAGAASGLTLPVTLPLVLAPPPVQAASVDVTNRGNTKTFPVIRFDGPVTGPRLDNLTTGAYVDLPTLVLAAGEYVEIDTRPIARTVLRDGAANAAGKLSSGSSFLTLPPGTSTLRFSAKAYDADASASVTARSAWER